jgi:23S rRNA (guanosine2251-2'-O)-methyltransferase
MSEIVVIAHNLRSTYNIGSILRTSDGLGVSHVYITGYSPYPLMTDDVRLPHVSAKLTKQIHKAALGAETKDNISYVQDVFSIIADLKTSDFTVVALEQTENSIDLNKFVVPEKVAIILGREVEGVESEVLAATDSAIEIPMNGIKESFNVSVASAIAIYKCRYP